MPAEPKPEHGLHFTPLERFNIALKSTTLKNRVPRSAAAAFSFALWNKIISTPVASRGEVAAFGTKIIEQEMTPALMAEFKTSPHHHPYPRMGIEVEDYFDKSREDELNAIHAPMHAAVGAIAPLFVVHPEAPISGNQDPSGLREIAIRPSHSAEIQGYALEQLRALGLFDHSNRPSEHQKPISLHINFELPKGLIPDLIKANHLEGDFDLVTQLFAVAYTTPGRIQTRKTATSFKNDQEADWDKEEDATVIGKKRYELRVTELRDPDTMREMLPAAQKVVAAMISYMKVRLGLGHSPLEAKLAEIWERRMHEESDQKGIKPELVKFLSECGITITDPHSLEYNKDTIAQRLGDPEIVKKARGKILGELADEVGQIVEQELP